MKAYFKMALACLCAAASMNGYSQQYFRASVNGGVSTIQYSSDDISSKLFDPSSIGGGVTAEYIMFFNEHIGASVGVGVTMSQSKFELNTTMNQAMSYFSEDLTTKAFTYNADFKNWEEKQMIHTVDIPVGLVGKHKFSDDFTAMAGLGVRFQLPVKASYKVADDGTRTSSGYFKEVNGVVDGLAHHGFYTLNGSDVEKGELNTKTVGFSAYLDLGVMQKIGSQRVYYGVYGQYGFTQINAEAENPFLTQYGNYDSPLNSTLIEKSNLFSFGIKLGYVLPVKGVEDEETVSEAGGEEAPAAEETTTQE